METLIVILVLVIIALAILCLAKESRPKTKMVIEVHRRVETPTYRAQLKGNSKIYATGNSFYDAIGELINSNPEIFGKVEYLDKFPLEKAFPEKENKT